MSEQSSTGPVLPGLSATTSHGFPAGTARRSEDDLQNHYEVKGILGEGGMGTVYRVRHRAWNIDLAVKCPRPEYFRHEQHKANFEREAEAWVKLGLHPHTVSCYYVRRLDGVPHIFAELVEGGSVR